jgi:hypothetical protein
MKKLFYLLLVLFVTSLSITACTEEEVAPTTENGNGGGGVSDFPK